MKTLGPGDLIQPKVLRCWPASARVHIHVRMRGMMRSAVSWFLRFGSKPRQSERTALLVEDDQLVRQIVEQGLRRAGWTVVAAGSAEAALEFLRSARFGLMISDIVMQGMDGIELTRQALGFQPDLPVVLTSGYDCRTLNETWLASTVAFLEKPYVNSELLAIVTRVIGESRS